MGGRDGLQPATYSKHAAHPSPEPAERPQHGKSGGHTVTMLIMDTTTCMCADATAGAEGGRDGLQPGPRSNHAAQPAADACSQSHAVNTTNQARAPARTSPSWVFIASAASHHEPATCSLHHVIIRHEQQACCIACPPCPFPKPRVLRRPPGKTAFDSCDNVTMLPDSAS